MEGYTLHESDTLNGSPCIPLCVSGWKELLELGYTDPLSVLLYGDQSVIWAEQNGKVAGVLVWRYYEGTKELWIVFGYVHPHHRKKGLYRLLHERAVEIARAKGAVEVAGGVNPTNHGMIQVCSRLGRKLQYLTYSMHLEPEARGTETAPRR